MRNFAIATILCAQIILTGCAAFGVVETSDPNVKLNDAENLLIDQDRPLPAEKLIYEAIEIYQKQDNSRGLGNAYRTYGDLLQSPSLTKWGSKNTRFHDESVTYGNRAAKSQEYFSKALESYLKSEKQPLEAEQFDNLTNLYLNIAWVYFRLHDPKQSCEFYDKSLAAYTENIRRNPSAKPYVPSGFKSAEDLIASRKKMVGCD